jgi:hypothetical protein
MGMISSPGLLMRWILIHIRSVWLHIRAAFTFSVFLKMEWEKTYLISRHLNQYKSGSGKPTPKNLSCLANERVIIQSS